MELEKEKDRVRSEQGITGCEHCKHFVETQVNSTIRQGEENERFVFP